MSMAPAETVEALYPTRGRSAGSGSDVTIGVVVETGEVGLTASAVSVVSTGVSRSFSSARRTVLDCRQARLATKMRRGNARDVTGMHAVTRQSSGAQAMRLLWHRIVAWDSIGLARIGTGTFVGIGTRIRGMPTARMSRGLGSSGWVIERVGLGRVGLPTRGFFLSHRLLERYVVAP